MPATELRMRAHSGFTTIELIVVMLIAAIVAAVTIPNVTRTLGSMRSRGAASVIAADLQLAHSMAARQRRPVQIVFDTVNRVMRIRDFTTPTRIYSQRHFSAKSEHPVHSLETNALVRTIYPNGLVDDNLRVVVNAGGQRLVVTMTRVGQVRTSTP